MARDFILTGNTRIEGDSSSRPVCHAVRRMYRDIKRTLTTVNHTVGSIYFDSTHCMEDEAWKIRVSENDIQISASSDLGLIYAFHYLSETYLEIHPFWFWLDQKTEQKDEILIPVGTYYSQKAAVRYRGWFINDETFMSRWNPQDDEAFAWEMAFEALLRSGGNMVIPGTLHNFARYHELAADMGLMLTQHHVEPLGAELFSTVYPHLTPSYYEHPDLYETLWEHAIAKYQKQPTIWAIGFRGQGDCPYWENDGVSRTKTDAEKGMFLSRILKKQYEMIRSKIPEAVICTNLYGEMMELYREGVLTLPDDVIRIWGDNGFGKMVARRRGNHNPRTKALPVNAQEMKGRHGIYYHISFYDLQAASHTTMPPFDPEYYKRELGEAVSCSLTDYWIINCSNIRPHVPLLDLIAKMWQDPDYDVSLFYNRFVPQYYSENIGDVISLYKHYAKSAVSFGEHDDEKAGEQFYTHSVKILANQWMVNSNSAADYYQWAKEESLLDGQIQWLAACVRNKELNYQKYLQACEAASQEISGTLTIQVALHYFGCKGTRHFCSAWNLWREEKEMEAFYECGLAAEAFAEADLRLRKTETGIWKNFYKYECFADFKFTAHILRRLMGWIRDRGEGPEYYKWQLWLYNQETGNGEIITNYDNHLTEAELFKRLKELKQELWKRDLIIWNRV